MATDNVSFYSQNRLIQTSQTGGQRYSDTSHLVFPGVGIKAPSSLCTIKLVSLSQDVFDRVLYFCVRSGLIQG